LRIPSPKLAHWRVSVSGGRRSARLDNQEARDRRTAQHDAVTKGIALERKRALDTAQQEDRALREKVPVYSETSAFPYPVGAAQQAALSTRRATKAVRLEALVAAVQEDPNRSKTALADVIGVSRGTVAKYLDELAERGQLVSADTGCGYSANHTGSEQERGGLWRTN
jgi:biotin operon repressor